MCKVWGASDIQLQRSEVCKKQTTCGGHQDRLKPLTGVWRAAQLSAPLRTSAPHGYVLNKYVGPGRSVRKKSTVALFVEFAKYQPPPAFEDFCMGRLGSAQVGILSARSSWVGKVGSVYTGRGGRL